MSLLLSQVDFVPETFADYMQREVLKLNRFSQSQVLVQSDVVFPTYGSTVTLPYWEGLQGEAEVISDSSGLTLNNIGSHNEVAPVVQRGKMYGYDDLVASFTASDPMGNLAQKIGAFWARELDRTVVNTLLGAGESIDDNGNVVLDMDQANIDLDGIIDARALFGEYMTEGMVLAVNATDYAKLQKDDVVDLIPGSQTSMIQAVLDMPVILSNTLPAGYAMIARPGAARFADGSDARHVLEEDRDIDNGKYKYSTRQRWGIGATGASFTATPAGATATNAELRADNAWDAVDSPLRFGARIIKHSQSA